MTVFLIECYLPDPPTANHSEDVLGVFDTYDGAVQFLLPDWRHCNKTEDTCHPRREHWHTQRGENPYPFDNPELVAYITTHEVVGKRG